jgi:hypothetical protein
MCATFPYISAKGCFQDLNPWPHGHATLSVVVVRHGYRRGTLLEIRRGDVSHLWSGVWSGGEWEVLRWTQTHKDLEWFGPPERNTLRPIFLYCSRESLSTKLEKACVCCPRRACKLELVKLEKACWRWDWMSSLCDALLGGWPCPFIQLRERFTMHGSRVAHTVDWEEAYIARLKSGLHCKAWMLVEAWRRAYLTLTVVLVSVGNGVPQWHCQKSRLRRRIESRLWRC